MSVEALHVITVKMFEEFAWYLLAVILAIFVVNRLSETRNLPPGPFPLPIIGNAHKLATETRHLDLMAMEKIYGHVFRLYLGSQLVIVVSGQDAIKEVLVRKSAEFAGRPRFYTAEVYSQGKAIGFADYSNQWRLHNKITVSALKMYVKQVLKQGKVINEELDHLLERVGSRNGQPQDITKGISLAVMNVICALVFGSKYGINDPEVVRFLEMTKGVVKTLSSGSVVDVFPWLSFIPFNSIKTLKQSCKEREELIGKIYWEHVEANRVQNPQDLTDAMLKAKMEVVKDNASIKELLTDKQLILTISEMFIAGMETTSGSLCWALLYLIHNPKIQDLLHQELDHVIGPNRLPDLKDEKSLPLLQATIAETLRLSTPGPLAIPHKATVDTTLQGYQIAKETVVLVNLWSLHHDPDLWDAPNEFKPERFLDEDGNFVPPKADVFLPFSAGRRVCSGESQARIQVFLTLARLLHRFKFKNPPGCELPTLEPEAGLVLMPKPFNACAIKRHVFCSV